MILKILLKYKIFEWCLDTLFDKIKLNFNKYPSGIKIGDYYETIEYHSINDSGDMEIIYRFYNCKIISINSQNNENVKFSYQKCKSYPSLEVSLHYGISTCSIEGLKFFK